MATMLGYRTWVCDKLCMSCASCRAPIPIHETLQAQPPSAGQGWRNIRCYPNCEAAASRPYNSPTPERLAQLLAPKTKTFKNRNSERHPRARCTKCCHTVAVGAKMAAEIAADGKWSNARHHPRCPRVRATHVAPRPPLHSAIYTPRTPPGAAGAQGASPASAAPSTPRKRKLPSYSPSTPVIPQRERTAPPPANRRRLEPALSGAGASITHVDSSDGVECLGDVSIDEQLAQRQKELGVVDLSDVFSAAA